MSTEVSLESRGPAAPPIVRRASLDHGGRRSFLADVLTSHPPIQQRIIRLRGMGYQQTKREASGVVTG